MLSKSFLAAAGLSLIGSWCHAAAEDQTQFHAPFAPSEGMVAPVETPWRQELCLNGKWQFEPVKTPPDLKRGVGAVPELRAPTADGWDATPIRIPSPWNSNSWGNGRTGEGTNRPYVADSVYFPSYPAAWDGVRMGWLRRTFHVPEDWSQERLILHFEAVSGYAQIVVNGKPVGEHFDKFLLFDVDVTEAVNRKGDNELLVGVRDSGLFDVVTSGHQANLAVTYPAGSAIDRLIGIWNDVFLWNLPSVHVDDVFVQPQVAPINGDRSYESYAGRNEALAIDLYRMVTQVAKPRLAAFSASELIWFGLEQLPFGYRTDARPLNRTDGVFFPDYVEGVPGCQIERLPPYVATLNPGFDPALPPYKPMAMFEAMKAALDPRGPQPCPWDKVPVIPPPKLQPQPVQTIASVDFVGDTKGDLYGRLEDLGVPWAKGPKVGQSKLLIIDGETTDDAVVAKRMADAVWSRGGMVWVMARDKGAALPKLQGLLPAPVSMTNRTATSLVHQASDPLTDSFRLSDMYFLTQGIGDAKIEKAGLHGPLVDSGKVLLTAPNSDWSVFDRVGEIAKCGSMLIYEHLAKPSGAALVEVPRSPGKLWVSSLDASLTTAPAEAFWTQLLRNVGVEVHKPSARWLVPGGPAAESTWRYSNNDPGTDWFKPDFDDASWKTGKGGFGTKVPNVEPKTAWTTPEIYLRQEFDLQEVPRILSLLIYFDDEATVYLNGVEVFSSKKFVTNYKIVILDEKARQALKPGRNVIAVHAANSTDGQFIDVGLGAGTLSPTGKIEHDLLLDGPQN